MFLRPAVRQVTAVARQHLIRQIGDEPVLVGIAQDELPRLRAAPEPGVGSSPEPFISGCDSRSRKPKMVVDVVERRCRVDVEERQTTNTVGPCEESVVLLDGADGTVPRCARRRSRSRTGHLRPDRRSDVRGCNRRCPLICSPPPPCPRRTRVRKVVSESPGTRSVRSPFHVNANVIQRSELSIVACTSAADCTPSSTSGRACPRKPPCAATPS